jgi:hypothetical protein
MDRAWQWIDKRPSVLALLVILHSAMFALLIYLAVFASGPS